MGCYGRLYRLVHRVFSREEGIELRIGSVVIDCNDFDTMSAFWKEALRYVPRDQPEPDWVVLRDPQGNNVNVSLQKVPEKRVGKNRLHFDLYTDDPEAEIERLLGIGASRHPRTPSRTKTSLSLKIPKGTSSASLKSATSSSRVCQQTIRQEEVTVDNGRGCRDRMRP
ncbi:hypothetical protein BH20ACT23_BH20ACT23_02140 [soil metagenome]